MNHVRAMIGVPVITQPAVQARQLKRRDVRFPIQGNFFQEVIQSRQDLDTPSWCDGMDTIFQTQLEQIQEQIDILARATYQGATFNVNELVRVVVRLNLGFKFKEPNSNGDDDEGNEYFSVQLDVESIGFPVRYTLRKYPNVPRTSEPLVRLFFNQYAYGGCGPDGFVMGDDSKGNYKYVITDVQIISYKGRRPAAGCAKDASHANTKIVAGHILKNVVSPKNLCVIASIRHGLGLTNPHAGVERLNCRNNHFAIFGTEYKTSELLPLNDWVLERLGDHYNTDIAIVGEIDKLSSKSRDSVLTLYYEAGHVWLVIAHDSGYCRICNKQYTSAKWLAIHRRGCHRCPRCKRIHSSELNCDWCDVCQINHPVSQACNESRSEFYRNRICSTVLHNEDEKPKMVVMKFNRSNLDVSPKENVLHFDIETAQYPNMPNQVAINVEWSVKCEGPQPLDSVVFFEDDPVLYVVGYDGKCNALYSLGMTVTPPQRAFGGESKAWRLYSSYGRDSMSEFVSFLKTSSTPYVLNAYNGSRFDHIFLLQEWQAQGLIVKDIAFQGSCPILGTLVGEAVKHRIWDVCRHLCGSLSTNAKAAGLVVSKDSFTDFHLLTSDDAIQQHRTKLQEYCRKDVQVLTLLYETTAAEVYKKFGVHITDYVTTSHMTYSLAFMGSPSSLAEIRMQKLRNLRQTPRIAKLRKSYQQYIDSHSETRSKWDPIAEIWVYRAVHLEQVFRSALYGGRCYPTQPYWESSQLEAVRQGALGYEDVDDYVLDLDANSLYPTAMSMDMPSGDLHRWTPPAPLPTNLGIYYIRYITNKKLYNAPIPSRDKNGGLSWTLEDGEGWYTSVDIDNAKRFGYEVVYVQGYYWESSVRCFEQYINYLYTAKDHMKQLKYIPGSEYSPALYNQLKLLLNGLWGKTSQRPVARDVKQVKTVDDLTTFFDEHTNLQFMHMSDNPSDVDYWIQGDAVDRAGTVSKPVQIADFVLAYSRRIMLDVMDVVDPGLTKCSFLYTDTDSLFVKVTSDNKTRLESMLGPRMGQLSNDLCDPKSGGKNGKVLRMVAPAPKAYSAEYILDNDKVDISIHAKGIHTSFFNTHSREIADSLTKLINTRYNGEESKRSTFSWGSDGSLEEEKDGLYVSRAPYMKKSGAMGGFTISHSHISRQLGKTEFSKRNFSTAEEMSTPIGYEY